MILNHLSIKLVTPLVLGAISILIVILGFAVIKSNSLILLDWTLINLIHTQVKVSFILDSSGIIYSRVVLFISANVITFSKFYIKHDPFISRFTVLVILFIISMNLLIFIPHLITLLIGWDGLGISSFVLVIYYINPKSLAAGIITALTNRIGDVILLIAIGLTLNQGHWNIILIDPERSFLWYQVILITVAGMTKSAQMPFSRWLPAAMAAPTPVSALVHSSTLVTAGVFLLTRFYPFLRNCPLFSKLILFIAVSTILIAGVGASWECDIKKIIALSTLSQLGIIIIRLGLNLPDLAIFHIISHALFKALLFICAGELIAIHSHGQELRWIGNLTAGTPVSRSCILIANLALCGFPFIAGFYSKDLIIEIALYSSYNFVAVALSLVAVGLTSFYSVRFSLEVLWRINAHKPHLNLNESINTVVPIITISISSIIGGCIITWLLPVNLSCRFLPVPLKTAPLLFILLGVIIARITTLNKSILLYNPIILIIKTNHAVCTIWFLTPLRSQIPITLPITTGQKLLKTIDHGWLEFIGGINLNKIIISSRNLIIIKSPSFITSPSILSIGSFATITAILLIKC